MSEVKWTPGPWSVDAMGNVWGPDTKVSEMSVQPNQDLYCYRRKPQEEHEANAHLIAAAPELYDALEALTSYLGNNLANDYPTGVDTGSREFMAANAALEKARGAS